MREVFISFAVFVFCVSLTLFSQFNSPQVVNAAESETQSVQRTPVAKSSNVSNNNIKMAIIKLASHDNPSHVNG